MFEKIAIAVVAFFFLFAGLFALAWELAKIALVVVFAIFIFSLVGCNVDTVSTMPVESSGKSVHLPTKCRPYYNDGTDRWINCMGVGYK